MIADWFIQHEPDIYSERIIRMAHRATLPIKGYNNIFEIIARGYILVNLL
jgi:hypothetical protein